MRADKNKDQRKKKKPQGKTFKKPTKLEKKPPMTLSGVSCEGEDDIRKALKEYEKTPEHKKVKKWITFMEEKIKKRSKGLEGLESKKWISAWEKEHSIELFKTIVAINDPLNTGDEIYIYLRPLSIDVRLVLIHENLSSYNLFALNTAFYALQSKGYNLPQCFSVICGYYLPIHDYESHKKGENSVFDYYPWIIQPQLLYPLWRIKDLLTFWDICGSDILNVMPSIKDLEETKLTLDKINDTVYKALEKYFEKITSMPDKISYETEKEVHIPEKYVFRCKGDFWQLIFDGEELPALKDSKGLNYIRYLLHRPNKFISSAVLQNTVNELNIVSGYEHYNKMKTEEYDEEKLTLTDLGDPDDVILDEKYKNDLKRRLKELIPEREKAKKECDTLVINEINSEVKKIRQILYNKGRTFSDTSKDNKARPAVTMAINRSRKNIGKYNKYLQKYLNDNIDTAKKCCYRPPIKEPISWTF